MGAHEHRFDLFRLRLRAADLAATEQSLSVRRSRRQVYSGDACCRNRGFFRKAVSVGTACYCAGGRAAALDVLFFLHLLESRGAAREPGTKIQRLMNKFVSLSKPQPIHPQNPARIAAGRALNQPTSPTARYASSIAAWAYALHAASELAMLTRPTGWRARFISFSLSSASSYRLLEKYA